MQKKSKSVLITFQHQQLANKSTLVDFFAHFIKSHRNEDDATRHFKKVLSQMYDLEIKVTTKHFGGQSLISFYFTWANSIDEQQQSDDSVYTLIQSLLFDRKHFSKKVFKQMKQYYKISFKSMMENYSFYAEVQLNQFYQEIGLDASLYIQDKDLKKIRFKNVLVYYQNVFKNAHFNIFTRDEDDAFNTFKQNLLPFQNQKQFDFEHKTLSIVKMEERFLPFKTNQYHFVYVIQTLDTFPNFTYLKHLLINELLGGNQMSHLFVHVREQQGLVYQIESYYDRFTGFLVIQAVFDDIKSVNKIVDSIKDFMTFDVTDAVFKKTVTFLIEQMILNGEDDDQFLSECSLFNMFDMSFDINDKIDYLKNITKEDILQTLKTYQVIYQQIVGKK